MFLWFLLMLKDLIYSNFYWTLVERKSKPDCGILKQQNVHKSCFCSRKFYIRQNNNKVDSVETGRIVIADLRPWRDLEKCMYTTLFWFMMIRFYLHYLIYKYNFTCSLFWTTCKLTNDIKIINFKENRPFRRFSF